MKVRWSESSLSEVDDIFAHIHEQNRTAAAAVVERIKAVASLLQDFSEAGHLTDDPAFACSRPFATPISSFTRSILLKPRS